MKELELPQITGIGGWYMPTKVCDDIVDVFEDSKEYHRKGRSGNEHDNGFGVNLQIKDSYDISVSVNHDLKPFGEYKQHLSNCLDNYIKKYEYVNKINPFRIIEEYNIQKYLPGGGFKKWHFENATIENRVLVFMTYLNDVDDGGTEFLYQNLITPAEKGLTLIWPAGFTHTHRGVVSQTKTKYIATGWYSIG